MKIGRRRILLLASSVAVSALASDVSNSDLSAAGSSGGTGKPSPVGTKHAPVDGKDGMPHEGPFVETDAERTRKKQGTSIDDEIVVTKSYKDISTDLPQTNDAVMDDRVNSKPLEGTRGIEGGISEKSKDYSVSEKKPESPKDARPVPHSEKEKIQLVDGTTSLSSTDEDVKKMTVGPARVF
jgi:Ca2+/H+ antiporter, TMEM165/GDT1 family